MKILLFIVAAYCLVVVNTHDDVSAENGINYGRVTRHRPHYEPDEATEEVGAVAKAHSKTSRKRIPSRNDWYWPKWQSLSDREREARGLEDSWKSYRGGEDATYGNDEKAHLREPTFELPDGFETEVPRGQREMAKYYQDPKHSSNKYESSEKNSVERQKTVIYEPEYEENDGDSGKVHAEPSHYSKSSGSFLSRIKENIHDGKVLGFSSFVEHFSENDDAEELKAAMREGSLDDIKRLVPKSGISFQIYRGAGDETTVKTEPVQNYRKPEMSWNESNEWHRPSPTRWPEAPRKQVHNAKRIPYKVFVPGEKTMRTRNHPENRQEARHREEESNSQIHATTTASDIDYQTRANEIYPGNEDRYAEIVPSIGFELPGQAYTSEKGYEFANGAGSDRERESHETQTIYEGFHYDSDNSADDENFGSHLIANEIRKSVGTPKPPEDSKLYYERLENSEPFKGETYYQPTVTYEFEGRDITGISPSPAYGESLKVGRIVVEQETPTFTKHSVKYLQKFAEPTTKPLPEVFHVTKKPLGSQNHLVKSTVQPPPKKPTTASISSEEEFGRDFAYRSSPSTTAEPIRHVTSRPTAYESTSRWSKPDNSNVPYTTKYMPSSFSPRLEPQKKPKSSPVGKLEKILNQQAIDSGVTLRESIGHGRIERPVFGGKETGSGNGNGNGNVFLTKEFQNEISEYFNGGKSDFEWVPSPHFGYDSRGQFPSSTVSYYGSADSTTAASEPKPKKQRQRQSQARSERNFRPTPKNEVFLNPDTELHHEQREFSVSASYKIDKNRKSDDVRPHSDRT